MRTLIRGLGAHHSTYDTNRNYRPRYLVRRSVDDFGDFESTSGQTSGLTSGLGIKSETVLCTIYKYEIIDDKKTAMNRDNLSKSLGYDDTI